MCVKHLLERMSALAFARHKADLQPDDDMRPKPSTVDEIRFE